MGKPRATSRIPPGVLAAAHDALDAREGASSVWRRLLRSHGIKARTWADYATQHRRRRQARAEWARLSIARQLSPSLIQACEKMFCLQTWARLRKLAKYRSRTKGSIDVLACEHVRKLYPRLRVTPRTLAGWRQRYVRVASSDRFASTVAGLLGISLNTLGTRRKA